jgi:hypothetical protein
MSDYHGNTINCPHCQKAIVLWIGAFADAITPEVLLSPTCEHEWVTEMVKRPHREGGGWKPTTWPYCRRCGAHQSAPGEPVQQPPRTGILNS